MTADEICYGTIAEIAAGVRERKFSPVEVVEAHLERIAGMQPKLNAFVHLDAEGALAQARRAEAEILGALAGSKKSGGDSTLAWEERSFATLRMTPADLSRDGRLGPLHGVPVTVKSCIDVAGWPAAAGSSMRKEYVAGADAPLVARLRAAGAILLGTTNTPENLMAYETDNLLSGKTSNPWDLARSSGGSSGGEAAAIAAGCSMGGVGSDGGGSIRVPAHFCGICGLKPTPGRIPGTGHFPGGGGAFGWIGVVGPMARTVADVRILFEVMAGPDAGDALSAPVPLRRVEERELRGLKIGVLETDALGRPTPETTAAVERAAKILSEQGFGVKVKRLAGLERAIELWWYFFGPVIGDIIRNGATGHEELMSPMLREFVALTTAEKEMNYDEFLHACGERDQLRAELLRQMEDVKILLSPVSTGPAFRHGEGNWRLGEKECYRDTMRFSQWLNLAGFPGVAVPMGKSNEGLPIGVQVIGRPWEEELVLAVAEVLERGRGEWEAPKI
jgi:Asp-tRNA(Asn)/Glu-tRNA(Gln) amidotransferase A subunit family amidase